jgi:beta-lysine 5,6-aminomutase beta subunit
MAKEKKATPTKESSKIAKDGRVEKIEKTEKIEEADKTQKAELIKPYGDTLNDGRMQISFTLPVPNSAKAKKAAEAYLVKLNLEHITIAFSNALSENFTYFVAYASAIPFIDFSTIVSTEAKVNDFDFYEINDLIKQKLKRKVTVIGATIGTDAHTVGIDAIMNMKGYKQNYGLERYPEMKALNLGAQITCDELMAVSLKMQADAILVSQTVTQKDAHIHNFTEFIELLENEGIRERFLVLAGGPRVTNDLAIEMGYDAGFGPGTLPSQVASYIVCSLINKAGETL